MSDPIPVQDMTYEQARAELIEVVQGLETGSLTLAMALSQWERGQALVARCQEWLDQAKTSIEAYAPDGQSSTEPGPPPTN